MGMGMGWVWGSKFRPHGSPGVQLPTSADNVTLLAVVRQWIDIICPPDGPTAANRRPNDGTDRQTDGRTLASFIDPAAHSCIRAVSEITKQHNYVGRCAVVIATAHIFLFSLLQVRYSDSTHFPNFTFTNNFSGPSRAIGLLFIRI